MNKLNYGVFSEFWDGHPNHLPLLNLYEPPESHKDLNLAKSIDRLDFIISTNSEEAITDGIQLLLEDDNWRPHLVAALVILKISKIQQSKMKMLLWKRVKQWSWVSPQILVVLSMIDPEFDRLAKDLQGYGYKTEHANMDGLLENQKKGPVQITINESKAIASAQYLLNGAIVDTDNNDRGGSIAKNWKQNLMKLIETGRFSL
ncbi:MAG: hypothetical protein Roseis2KO_40730 [Roseivirga sp.]